MKHLLIEKLKTKKGLRIKDSYGPIVIPILEKLQFMIDDYGFTKSSIDMARNEVWVKIEGNTFRLYLEYELFNYPHGRIEILINSKWTILSLYELSPMTNQQLKLSAPIQVDSVLKRVDQFVKIIRKHCIQYCAVGGA
jgi:hypothetical protein